MSKTISPEKMPGSEKKKNLVLVVASERKDTAAGVSLPAMGADRALGEEKNKSKDEER